jgi:hypothetical protein
MMSTVVQKQRCRECYCEPRGWQADTAAGGADPEGSTDEMRICADFLEEQTTLRRIGDVVEENRLGVAVTGA